MIIFYIFAAIITGCTINESPVLGLFFYAILLFFCYQKKYSLYQYVFFSAVVFVSMIFYQTNDEQPKEVMLQNFTIHDYKYYTDSVHYILKHEGNTYEMYVDEAARLIPIGSSCTGKLTVTIPQEQRNFIKRDGIETLQINELSGRIYIDRIDEISCVAAAADLTQYFNKLRYIYMSKVLNATEYSYKYDILTLSIGNKSYISSEFFDALQKLGIYHLYVISGTHVAFLSGVIFGVLKALKLPLNTIKIIIITALVLFLCLNFFSPSVFRAVFMGVLLLICSFFKKKPYIAIISLSAILQILMNPYVIYHAGFQLSYVTTYFILLSRPFFMKYNGLTQLILITVICELSTLVIVLIQFNEISLSGLVLNIVFIPLFSFLIFPSVIIFNILIYFPYLEFIDAVYNVLYSHMKMAIHFLADGFKHRIPIKNLSAIDIIILLIITYKISVYTLLLNYKKIFICTSMFIIVLAVNHRTFDKDFTLTMVDVGQGEAFVLQDHRHLKTVVIDTGGMYSPDDQGIKLSDKTLLPYLKEQGIDTIDLIIISHLDIDHSGELLHVVSKKETGNIMMNKSDVKFEEWREALPADIEKKIIDSREISQFKLGDMYFHNISMSDVSGDSNEQSIVLKTVLSDFSILFTGDIGVETENMLFKAADVNSDILKVGHHGSDTSTSEAFVKAVSPAISLISAGENNRYGHPHQSVLDTLSSSRILSTNTGGMVEFSINHDTICIRQKLLPEDNTCLKK